MSYSALNAGTPGTNKSTGAVWLFLRRDVPIPMFLLVGRHECLPSPMENSTKPNGIRSLLTIQENAGSAQRNDWRHRGNRQQDEPVSMANQTATSLRTSCRVGKFNTSLATSVGDSEVWRSLAAARFRARLPPSTREMLNRDRLPQTRHLSCGLSVTQSHSAHKTAFCRQTALKDRSCPPLSLSVDESFITEPPRAVTTVHSL